MHKGLLAAGAILGFLAVALGAFGSHVLKDRLDSASLEIYDIGVRYQLAHALAVVLAAVAATQFHQAYMAGAGWLFTAGTLLFSGSLYLIILTGLRTWGILTPVGGLMLLGGWAMLLIGALRS